MKTGIAWRTPRILWIIWLAGISLLLSACASTTVAPTNGQTGGVQQTAADEPASSATHHDDDDTADNAPTRSSQQAEFQQWRAQFRAQAEARGVSPATLDATLGKARLIPKILKRDRSQPEFSRRVWAYLDSLVSAQRIHQGRQQLATYNDIAAQ